jgi:transcriptional regulator with XRE-family HTH domain
LSTRGLLNNTLGKYIRLRRHALKMTQQNLADKTALDLSYISDLENGKRNPSYETLYKVALALNTVPSQISKEVEQEVHNDMIRLKKE